MPDKRRSQTESEGRADLLGALRGGAVPEEELLNNLGLFVPRQLWGRMLFMLEIYRRIVPVHGSIMEFGVRWGQNMALFSAFRGMFEPYNYNRKIIGFDTFEGFPSVHAKDGAAAPVKAGNYSVSRGHEDVLADILHAHDLQSPISHIEKFELVKGDVTQSLDSYLDAHPETVIALAYLDLDLFEPTRHVLERILPLMPRGAVLAFDELNYQGFPGETVALREALGIHNLRIERMPFSSLTSFAVIE